MKGNYNLAIERDTDNCYENYKNKTISEISKTVSSRSTPYELVYLPDESLFAIKVYAFLMQFTGFDSVEINEY